MNEKKISKAIPLSSTTIKKPNTRTQAMLKGAALPLLLRMASPNMLAFFIQASVSMLEVWYIGRLGTVSLAAIALMFPGLMLMQMLSGGAMGGAVTSAVARAIGGHQMERAERLIWHALLLALSGGVFFLGLYHLLGVKLLVSLGARGPVLEEAVTYGNILFTGCVLIWLMSLLSAVFRGMGNMRFPSFLMVIGAMVQVPLAGSLILGWFGFPKMGIAGAATATLGVAGMNTLILLTHLVFGKVEVPLRRARLQIQRLLFEDILRVGALASLSPVFTVLTITLVNGLISQLGPSAIAGYGIGTRLEFLLIPMVFGLGASMTSLVGLNMGAGNIIRSERIGWIGGACAALLTGSVGLCLAFFPGLWMDLFTTNPDVFASGASYLKIVGPVFLFQGLGLSLYFASQGARAVFWPVAATFIRFGIAGVGAWLGVKWFGFERNFIFGCISAGMVSYGLITSGSLYLGAWRHGKGK
jgi:putative MATE family efflux protein